MTEVPKDKTAETTLETGSAPSQGELEHQPALSHKQVLPTIPQSNKGKDKITEEPSQVSSMNLVNSSSDEEDLSEESLLRKTLKTSRMEAQSELPQTGQPSSSKKRNEEDIDLETL